MARPLTLSDSVQPSDHGELAWPTKNRAPLTLRRKAEQLPCQTFKTLGPNERMASSSWLKEFLKQFKQDEASACPSAFMPAAVHNHQHQTASSAAAEPCFGGLPSQGTAPLVTSDCARVNPARTQKAAGTAAVKPAGPMLDRLPVSAENQKAKFGGSEEPHRRRPRVCQSQLMN